jgi:aminodeoxyfutalosine deaminase
LIRYRASWVLPISRPPIQDGWVAVDGGRIVACGGGASGRDGDPARSGGRSPLAAGDSTQDVDLGSVAILPGLVNAHTHLELSYLHGQIPRCPAFVTWIRAVMSARRERLDANGPDIFEPLGGAIREAVSCGTAVVGDVTNTLITVAPLMSSPLAAVVFYELIGFNVSDPEGLVDRARTRIGACSGDRVRVRLAAHAPYSVGPRLFRAIRNAVARDALVPSSLHLAESAEEVEFVRAGTGPWRALLEEVGAWDDGWVGAGASPLQYVDGIGVIDAQLMVVHGVHLTGADLQTLARRGATLVTCPRSNDHTGAGIPPVRAFYEAGVPVAVGTDSLASVPDLNVMAELAALRALAPEIPARTLLDSATREGARALGFAGEYGTIEPGKRARLLAVSVPAGIDVEEYLVSGIPPDQMSWVQP